MNVFLEIKNIKKHFGEGESSVEVLKGVDIEGDNTMITVFLYLVMVIIAFVFAITTGNTIAKEANVIGTLRASGYTKGELVRHYLATPMIVVLVPALR